MTRRAYPRDAPDALTLRIEMHAPLVKRLAHQLYLRLPASVEIDDLIQTGMMGLLEAAQSFEESQGVQFETFASQRIRGAMLDELRSRDWLPRQVRKQLRETEAAIRAVEQKLGRAPLEQEIADHMLLPLSDYQHIIDEGRGHQLLYYEDFKQDEDYDDLLDKLMPDHKANPLHMIEEKGFRATLISAITALPEREKLLMGLYYEEELNLKEIGEVLGVSESRVSQLHTQAISRLRARLSVWLNDRFIP